MDDNGANPVPTVAVTTVPAVAERRARGPGAPPVVDAEFRVLPPVWRLWRALRDNWWALGPYLAYCTALWGLAALIAWVIDRGRGG